MKIKISAKILCAATAFASAILSGCSQMGLYPPPAVPAFGTPAISKDSYSYDEDKNVFTIRTNKESYLSAKGYTLWFLMDKSAEDNMNFRLCKKSGDAEYSYGILIGADEAGKSMLCILINANGFWGAGKIRNGKYIEYKPMGPSGDLKRGIGIENTVSVRKVSAEGKYEISFNGSDAKEDIYDSSASGLRGGRYGYVATVSPTENFVRSWLEVEYEKLVEE